MLNTKEIIEQMKAYEIKSVEERYKNLSEKEIKEISPNPIYYQIKGVPLPD